MERDNYTTTTDAYLDFCICCGSPTHQRGPHCSTCGSSVKRPDNRSPFNDPIELPSVKTPLTRLNWICDNTTSSRFYINRVSKSEFLMRKLGGNCWRSIWANRPLVPPGSYYFEIKCVKFTGGAIGFVEPVTDKHRTEWTNYLQHYYLHDQWANAAKAPWCVSTQGTTIYSENDTRAIPSGTAFKTGDTIGLSVDFFQDKIDMYRNGTFYTTLVVGIRRFRKGLHPAFSMHYDADVIQVFTNKEKPVSLQEIESVMLRQQDFLRETHASAIRLRRQLDLSRRGRTIAEEELDALRRELDIKERILEQYRTTGNGEDTPSSSSRGRRGEYDYYEVRDDIEHSEEEGSST